MKNQRGISLIKIILIIIVIIVIALWVISKISQKIEKEEKEREEAKLAAKYEASYNIGDKITTDQYEVTVKKIEERTKVGIPKYYRTVDDYYYTLVCATIDIKNISNESQRICDNRPDFSIYFKLEDEFQNIYYNDSEFTTYYSFEFDNINYSKLTLQPGKTATIAPVYKMDKSKYQSRAFYLHIIGDNALVKIK